MGRGHHLRTCAILLLVVCAVEGWSIWRAVVPAQDVVRFVAVAQAIQQQGVRDVWQRESGPPLFPTVVALVHRGLQRLGWQSLNAWARSAQLAAAVALVLAVVPFYGLMVCWRGPKEAVIAAALFCFLPELVRLGGDGLSDSLFLLCLLTGWLAAAWACRRAAHRTTRWADRKVAGLEGVVFCGAVAVCGAMLAVATLVHRQAWLAMAGLLAALVFGMRGRGSSECCERAGREARRTDGRWRWCAGVLGRAVPRLVAGAGFALGAAVMWGACLAWLAPLASDQIAARLLGKYDPDQWAVLNPEAAGPKNAADWARTTQQRVAAMAATKRHAERAGAFATRKAAVSATGPAAGALLGEAAARGPRRELRQAGGRETLPHVPAKETEISSRRTGYGAAVWSFLGEMASASQYWIGGLALLGFAATRRRVPRTLDRAMTAYLVVVGLGTVQHAAASGYLSTRHVVPLAVLALGWAARGVETIATWLTEKRFLVLAGWLIREGPSDARHRSGPIRRLLGAVGAKRTTARAVMCWTVGSVAVAACLPRIAQPLHRSREAHRRVGDWLAETGRPGGYVLDSRGWSALYSGRTTYRMQAADKALENERLAYIVLEQGELRADTQRGRRLQALLDGCGPPAARFRHPTRPNRDDVLVFRWQVPTGCVGAVPSPSRLPSTVPGMSSEAGRVLLAQGSRSKSEHGELSSRR